MGSETFALYSREGVIRFEQLLNDYMTERTGSPLNHISLTDAYDWLQFHPNPGQVFTVLLDIQINFSLLFLDVHAEGATWNRFFSKGKLEGGSILDSYAKFSGKMDIHRFNTAYIFRYRAIWDKIMGLLVLLYAPDEYNNFTRAKSRKKCFKKLAEKHDFLNEGFVKTLSDLITRFDDRFRTAEAHGSGFLRKYSFTMESMENHPEIELIDFWNKLNGFIATFGQVFSSRSEP